ncbi:MAG: GDP-mannose 4,6-dehydratase [Candidatus Riflebacteria bacterium HGW-Riflebacteria-1]|jgi:GDPmannose 4,6-dehydratase|nr:MAG: GDP-mannose 4,6-dehydratase [Candidatus Riflebacteria bacterium HGW-Riflebacteria-1]
MKTAIITGISGQDGPYLARLLVEKNYRVIGTVRSYRSSNVKSLEYLKIAEKVVLEELDLLDITNVIRLLMKYKPDEVYNLAAQSSVGLSFSQPIGTFSFNTASVNNLLETIRLLSPMTKLYQASSSEMFGCVKKLPITLDAPMHPVSPYAVSKVAAHFMVMNYREAYGLFVCNGILFNHESFLRSGNFFVKKIILEALKIKRGEKDCVFVGNLDLKRDFGYAPRYVEAMWMMMQLEKPEDFIVCSGKSICLRDIVYYVFDKLKLDNKLIVVDDKLCRPNEVYDIVGDNSKARLHLDWYYDDSFFDILDILIHEELQAQGA